MNRNGQPISLSEEMRRLERRMMGYFSDNIGRSMPYSRLGLSEIIDWDNEARTEIEGINSAHAGGIDRSSNQNWRPK